MTFSKSLCRNKPSWTDSLLFFRVQMTFTSVDVFPIERIITLKYIFALLFWYISDISLHLVSIKDNIYLLHAFWITALEVFFTSYWEITRKCSVGILMVKRVNERVKIIYVPTHGTCFLLVCDLLEGMLAFASYGMWCSWE